ncbi:basic proline-rich protein [Pochonia chlamydosporia 170]|uniref:Basic proline-rich protein n=1 Tax=Pochonia chlamydosporia 170 TaxID=1380566 RepID=A0A179G4N6_METCM|nr:basic proline-rich protein [Pochonia chlamydosporia 170]OAQ72303.1 basic proline-rich protein [Pochonia chlamydosporia 170]
MEPVPETERMEAFKSSPVPSLLLSSNPNAIPPLDLDMVRKPPTIRRSTDPNPTSPISPSWGPSPSVALPYRPRTASPLSGGHSRSRSAASLASPMSRTQSMPGVSGSGRILYSPQLRPASPSNSGSPSRVRTPRKPVDEAFPAISPVRTSVLDHEKKQPDRSSSPVFGPPIVSSSRLRRSSSPFRSVPPPSSSSLSLLPSTPSSVSSASSLRGYDALSMGYGGSLSSIPSTPTSARSRSPSISSLETIPDSPDAEEAALEAERLAQLKAAADAADGADSSDSKGRPSMDAPPRGRTLSFGPRDKRKRWSVCGAERRGDLDLETIWED